MHSYANRGDVAYGGLKKMHLPSHYILDVMDM